jgi:hypothetical protein
MIHVFGDSFSEDYKKLIGENDASTYMSKYIKYMGRDVKLYIDLLSEYLNQPLTNYAFGGCCNEYILMKFMENYDKIKPNDVVVFGWTEITRFLLASDDPFYDWRSSIHPTNSLSKITLDEMHVLRNNKLYKKKQLDIIKFIDQVLKNNTTIHWTWSTIPKKYSSTITKETNGLIEDSHYGEEGHKFLFDKIKEQLGVTKRVRINLWDQFNIHK